MPHFEEFATFTAGALNVNNGGFASTDTFVTGSITTQNLNANSGTATAGSFVVTPALNGVSNLSIQVTGVYTGALTLQASLDGANWVNFGGPAFLNVGTGLYSTTIASAAVGIWQADVAAYRFVRLTALAAVTGTAVVSIEATAAAGTVALDAPLPQGSGVSTASTYPGYATAVTSTSGNVAAASAVATLAGVAGKTTYVSGLAITGAGATAGSVVVAVLSGTISGSLNYIIAVPTGAILGVNPVIVEFNPPVPASAVNTAIVLTLPSLGTGNTNAAVNLKGYQI